MVLRASTYEPVSETPLQSHAAVIVNRPPAPVAVPSAPLIPRRCSPELRSQRTVSKRRRREGTVAKLAISIRPPRHAPKRVGPEDPFTVHRRGAAEQLIAAAALTV